MGQTYPNNQILHTQVVLCSFHFLSRLHGNS